jgi:hypothetical protein
MATMIFPTHLPSGFYDGVRDAQYFALAARK